MPADVQQLRRLAPLMELRQYRVHPGKRDVLMELFEREFIESQEALGVKIIGQFRDLDDPDLFVWVRGFDDLPQRAGALAAFYGGPVWQAHRAAANATMVDSDNVLQLRPAREELAFWLAPAARPPQGATAQPAALIVATIYYLRAPAADNFIDWFEQSLKPLLRAAGAAPLASLVTDPSPNNFPNLPVREDESVFVWFAWFEDQPAYERYLAELSRLPGWLAQSMRLAACLERSPEVHRLSPGARSLLRSRPPTRSNDASQ